MLLGNADESGEGETGTSQKRITEGEGKIVKISSACDVNNTSMDELEKVLRDAE